MMENLVCDTYHEPFPHLIIKNFYNEEEVELIWEELNFYTKPGKLLPAEKYGGVVGYTEAKAISLDALYTDHSSNDGANFRSISNILRVSRKLFTSGILDEFAKIHDCCSLAPKCNNDFTKVRYYHNGESYAPHIDKTFQFLAFSYFYKEPKKFEGGEIYFPKYKYELTCGNNSTIILPGWVQHGVKEVRINDSDYYDGYGRYCISNFFSDKPKTF